MQRAPQQARSIASMQRMLDAAESLLDEGGPDALTVEAVVRTSGSSTGSFYGRFGDRQGLLIAMQDRFLDRLGATLGDTIESLPDDADLAATIDQLVSGMLDAFRTHRASFVAYMLLNRSEPAMRARGAVASVEAARAIARVIDRHADEVAHPDLELAADFAYRALFAVATQTVMFDDAEISLRPYSPRTHVEETTRLLLAYLRTNVPE